MVCSLIQRWRGITPGIRSGVWVWAVAFLLALTFPAFAAPTTQPTGTSSLRDLAQQLAGNKSIAGPMHAPTTQPASVPTSAAAAEAKLPLGASRRGEGKAVGAESTGNPNLGWMVQTLAALAAVVGLIFILRWVMSRWSGREGSLRSSHQAADVLAKVSLGAKNQILFIRLGHRILVVGDSPGGMRTLANIDDPDEIASVLAAVSSGKPGSVSAGFRQLLDRFHGQYPENDDAQASTGDAETGFDEKEFAVDHARDRLSGLLARVRATQQATGGTGRKGAGR